MKIFPSILFVVFLSFPAFVFSQIDLKSNSEKPFTIHGGFFFDYEKALDDQPVRLAHPSVNKFGIGYFNFRKQRIQHFSFDVSIYNTEFTIDDQVQKIFDKSKLFVDLEYFAALNKHEVLDNKLHVGILLSGSFIDEETRRSERGSYPTEKMRLLFGTGVKALYAFPIFKDKSLFISSEVNLVNAIFSESINSDPSIPTEQRSMITLLDIEFLQPIWGIDFGIVL